MTERTIGDFFDIKGGKRLPKGSSFSENKTPFPYLRVTDFQRNGLKSEGIKYIDAVVQSKIKRYTIDSGSVYISIAGTIGIVGIVPDEFNGANLTENAAKFVPKKGFQVHNKFLSYLLNSYEVQRIIESKTMAVGVPKLALFRIQEIPIILPPLSTQKKIAAILDAADMYLKKTKTLIEKYDQLAQSLFLDMFGNVKGEKIRLDECCEINPKKSEIAHIDKDTEVSFVPMSNVSIKGELILTEIRSLFEVWNGFTYFQENDVVFAKITPCMENGKGAIMHNLKNKIGFGTTEFHVLRPIPSLTTSSWLYYLTSNNKFRKQAEKNMTGSAGQKRVPTDFFSKYKVICPAITIQNQFAKRIELIDQQKQQAQASLQKAEELFNSLLQKAFKGELVSLPI